MSRIAKRGKTMAGVGKGWDLVLALALACGIDS
jgi:hypothetical protein